MAISTHDDEIRRDVRCVGHDAVRHVDAPTNDPFEVNLEIMASQMTSDVGVRQVIAFERFGRHGHHLDGFGTVEKWQSIRNRARLGALRPSTPGRDRA